MAKIKIRTSLNTINEMSANISNEIIGEMNNNEIIYNEGEIKVIITILDNKVTMSRINDDYVIKMEFILNSITEGIYDIKDVNTKFNLAVETNELTINEGMIFVNYHLNLNNEDMGIFKFQLDYEVI